MHHNKLLYYNILKVQLVLGLSNREMSVLLEISEKNYKLLLSEKYNPNVLQVYALAEALKFHAMDLFKIDFDFKQLLSNYMNIKSFPERYNFASYSKTTPIINVLNYIEKNRGEVARSNILRHFQISDEILLKEDAKTNIFLISDMLNYSSEIFHLHERDFLKMGQLTPMQKIGKHLSIKLASLSRIEENIDCFFSECTYMFDRNCNYKIEKLTKTQAIVSANPRKEVLDELKVGIENFGNNFVCTTRMGVISSLTFYNYKKFLNIKKLPPQKNESMSSTYVLDLSTINSKSTSTLNNSL